ncbi:shugoshin C terminus [Striga asiatica]|uniref:Shugoshin C terminus n=1 Tax=Striga asiatica TaxID=4170 RepID=A0A5A7QUD9_STRAF|nr:shugoshin C terminus [Striga asiatica]
MSKTEGFLILETQNAAAGGGADETAGQYPQNMARRKLADISNLPQKSKPSVQDDKSKSIPVTAKAYIEKLQKENMTLAKMLAQRNKFLHFVLQSKIIEQSGIELERLRSILIQVQEQNQQLALSHTQMLRELNLGKDRLKALQHELGCKNGLLKARKLEGGEACKIPGQSADVEVNLVKLPKEGETLSVCKDNGKPRNNKRSRLQSSGSSEPLQSEDSNGNRRPSVRRQSARFKAAESKSVEDPSERDDSKFSECPLPQEPVVRNGSTSGSTSVEEDNNLVNVDLIKLPEEGETSHVGRDAEKPHNVKRRLRSQSLGSSESLQPEENAGNRRVSVRRQSARFKALEQKTVVDESEKHDIKFIEQALPDEKSVLENKSTSKSGSATDGDNRGSSGFEYNPPETGRSSLSRPSRLAAKKVQSYKEIPVNIKMRRE